MGKHYDALKSAGDKALVMAAALRDYRQAVSKGDIQSHEQKAYIEEGKEYYADPATELLEDIRRDPGLQREAKIFSSVMKMNNKPGKSRT